MNWLVSNLFKKVYSFPNGSEIEEVKAISEGGFAFVSLGKDKNGDEYALKKMLCQDKKRLELARHEVEVLNALPEHKNIIQFYQSAVIDAGAGGGGTAGTTLADVFGGSGGLGAAKKEVVMLLEYCPNGTLLDWILSQNGKVIESEVLKALQDVAEAVFLLHSHKPPIVHQDLKVENVLKGKDGNWKLCDFGSWTNEKIDLTNASRQEIMRRQDHFDEHVTMMYRPPEMADLYQRFTLHTPIDMWQVGCILFTLMFFKQPFQDCTAPLAIAHAGYEFPPDFVPGITYSENLETTLHWLMTRNPENRLPARNLVRILWEWEGNPPLVEGDPNTLVVAPSEEALKQKKEKRKRCEANKASHNFDYNPERAVLAYVAGGGPSSPQQPTSTMAGMSSSNYSQTFKTKKIEDRDTKSTSNTATTSSKAQNSNFADFGNTGGGFENFGGSSSNNFADFGADFGNSSTSSNNFANFGTNSTDFFSGINENSFQTSTGSTNNDPFGTAGGAAKPVNSGFGANNGFGASTGKSSAGSESVGKSSQAPEFVPSQLPAQPSTKMKTDVDDIFAGVTAATGTNDLMNMAITNPSSLGHTAGTGNLAVLHQVDFSNQQLEPSKVDNDLFSDLTTPSGTAKAHNGGLNGTTVTYAGAGGLSNKMGNIGNVNGSSLPAGGMQGKDPFQVDFFTPEDKKPESFLGDIDVFGKK